VQMSGLPQYAWRPDELTALQNKGIELVTRLDIRNAVQLCRSDSGEEFVVKCLHQDSIELETLRTLLSLPSSRNHVVPCELIPCETTTLVLMPYLYDLCDIDCLGVHGTLHILSELVEALSFMHEHCIAHADVAERNAVTCKQGIVTEYRQWRISPDRVYLIDFECSRSFPKGPGQGLKIRDWRDHAGHYDPPEGKDLVDPYAYDVYSLGHVMSGVCNHRKHRYPLCTTSSLMYVIGTMLSNDPTQRPTMRYLARIVPSLQAWNMKMQWLYRIFPKQLATRIDRWGWILISFFK